jgi:uncharacterized protein YfaS (alpha-2-macroglobulin family)
MKRVAIVAVIAACGGGKGNDGASPNVGSASPVSDEVYVQLKDAPPGLDIKVSDGKAGPPAFDRNKIAPARKLADSDAAGVLSRAKPITTEPTDQQAFALRPSSQPAPRPGTEIKATFPPPASSLLPPKPSDAGQDLKVLRFMPEGAVPVAPELSVTFSQPMVAVTSQGDASGTQPVKLTPQPKGNWRWLGTRTILFDPNIRFPQATTYHIEVPAGTKSVNGGVLETGTKFSFETPTVTMVSHWPNDYQPQHLDVPAFVLFDQKIDAQAVLAKITVTANGKAVAIKRIDDAEAKRIADDKKAKPRERQLAAMIEAAKKNEQDGRWIAFRPAQDLPKDAQVVVTIPPGTPSAEGPNLTKAAQTFTFKTYPPLTIVEATCGYQANCPPGTPFVIRFNNPLDSEKFEQDQITVGPEIPALHVVQNHTNIIVQGATKARTSYKATVSANIVDDFGQTLGKAETRAWTVGDARPSFYGPNGMVVLDPAAKKPTLDFFTTNYEQLKVTLYKVAPSDLDAYYNYLRNRWNKDNPPRLPGAKVFDQLIKTTVGKNELVETSIDMTPALTAGLGHAIAIVEPYPWTERWEPPKMISWVQSTRLAVDAYVDASDLVAFATELDTGKPASGVELEIRPFGLKARSDDKGMATIALSAGGVKGAHHLIARRGPDVALVTDHSGYYNESGSWVKQGRGTNLSWYVMDDRKMYKPGEEVSLKGWLRTIDTAKGGDIGGLTDGISNITYTVRDSRNNELAKGQTTVSAVGGFDAKFTLPKTPNLGYAWIDFVASGKDPWSSGGGTYRHGFQLQEFRRPEFEVSAQASQGPFVVGGGGDVTVNAKYYSGGPLPGAPVNWYITASSTSFTPPNREDFTFGTWVPWWGYVDHGDIDGRLAGAYQPPKTWDLASKTDATGAHILHMDFLSVKPAMPMNVTTNASVTDVNRQTWTANATTIVHPSTAYVGLKTKKPFVEKGTPFDLEVIGVDLDGKVIAGAQIEVKAVRKDYEYKKGRYVAKDVDPQTCAVVASPGGEAVPCSFATKEGGTYQVTATILDSRKRPNQTTLTFWVAGGKQVRARNVAQERLELIPDKKEYTPGNTAEILIQAPFFPAEAIVSWRRSGLVKTEKIEITGPTKVITVPITDAMTPNMYVQVDLVGMSERLDDKGDPDPKLPKRPAYAVGSLNLAVPPKHRTLAVDVTPKHTKVGPGETTSMTVMVKDAQGRPVADAETAVIVVDEAVLSLTGYKHPSPIETFYGQRGSDVRDHYLRAYVKLVNPIAATVTASTGTGMGYGTGGARRNKNSGDDMDMLANEAPGDSGLALGGALAKDEEAAPARAAAPAPRAEAKADNAKQIAQPVTTPTMPGQGQAPGPTGSAIAIRTNFNPLAAFAPVVKTNAAGMATVEVKMPDNLTRYRIVAVAMAGTKQFGKGESAVTARLPLMVRPSPPRFLNFGDTFQLPIVVQNQTDLPFTVKLAARTTNAALVDGAGREVTVPANDRVEVLFPAAAEMAGTARFQIVGTAGSYTDAAEVALPVWTPATTEAFATYGVIDAGTVAQPVALPEKVITQFGGIEVTTASTNVQALTDALLYLVQYPYECAEQRASRVMAIVGLKDVLSAFKTSGLPSVNAMEGSVKTDVERLSQMQNYDGGFAYWERGRPSEPYLTVYVTNALVRAKAKGFEIKAGIIERAQQYLRNIESYYPYYYGPDIRMTISSYALYTRKLMGDVDITKSQAIFRQYQGPTKMNMEANAWLLGTMAGDAKAATERAAIVRHAMNKVSETAGAANFTVGYADGGHLLLASDRRVDAVMLESLIQEKKDLDLIPKVVTGLLAHRKKGRWLNTQENTYALLALDLYFRTYEKITPDFVARVWLGKDYAGDHAFKGRTTEYFTIPIPMKVVAEHDKQPLTIQKDGKGRLYYRIGMNYAPASLKLDPADYGFVVTRKYEAVDDPKDVTRRPDGTWVVKAGARVRVKLNMINENRRYHVALVDPMPAGFEAMNPALAVTGPIPLDPNVQKSKGAYWWWYGPWYEHQNLRDERVEAFASLLWEGVHTYQYVARATTPGNFVVPPPKAEEMYMPETFGRGGSDRVIVE